MYEGSEEDFSAICRDSLALCKFDFHVKVYKFPFSWYCCHQHQYYAYIGYDNRFYSIGGEEGRLGRISLTSPDLGPGYTSGDKTKFLPLRNSFLMGVFRQ